MGSIYNRKNIISLFAALLFVSDIFIFGPISIYQGNINALGFPLPTILYFLIIPCCVILVILAIIGIVLPEKLHQRFSAILSCLGILLWIQGTFLVWNLGVLDGTTIDWTKNSWRGFVDGVVWVILLGFAIFRYQYFYKFSRYIVFLILLFQFLMLCIFTFQKPEIWSNRGVLSSAPPKEVFQFSNKQNVIHIVLDQFGSTLFEKIIKKNTVYSEVLEGFTFFKEVTSPTRVTCLSVPSFLSGKVYTNDRPIEDFYQENYNYFNIQTVLSQRGFDLDVINQPGFLKKREIDTYYFNIPTPYNSITPSNVVKYKATFLIDLVLFRSFPYFLKRIIYNDQSWLISSFTLPEKVSQFEHYAANDFLDDITVHASINRDNPVYKYMHLMTPHPPLVVSQNLKFAGKVLSDTVAANFDFQAEYTWINVIRLLEHLKSLDLYNSTLIIIQSDHGSGISFNLTTPEGEVRSNVDTFIPSDAFLPLLIIKPPNQYGHFKVSTAQGELTDIPATICSLLNMENPFPGQSLFDINPLINRKRNVYYSSVTARNDAMVSGFFDDFQEVLITGSVFKTNSWEKGRIIKKSLPPYIWGTVLQFNKKTNNNIYLQQGWGFPEDEHIWNNGKMASIKLPIKQPQTDTIELICEVTPFLLPKKGVDKQKVEISINNIKVGEFLLSDPGQQTLRVLFSKKLIANLPEMLLGFSFPNATIGNQVGLVGEDRMLGVAFYSITFKECTP